MKLGVALALPILAPSRPLDKFIHRSPLVHSSRDEIQMPLPPVLPLWGIREGVASHARPDTHRTSTSARPQVSDSDFNTEY